MTIADHTWRKQGREAINKELILKILETRLNGKWIDPLLNSYELWRRDIFRFDTYYQQKKYRLIFWFKDNTTNHLWIRNCYRVD